MFPQAQSLVKINLGVCAWCSHNKHKYQIIVNLFKGKGCKSKTQTSHLNSCLFTFEKIREVSLHKHTYKILGQEENNKYQTIKYKTNSKTILK